MASPDHSLPKLCKAVRSKESSEKEEVLIQDVDTGLFAASDDLSDLTLVVEGKNLYVHKMILAKTSPVFRAMFYPQSDKGFREKDATELVLKDKKHDDMVNFLAQVYVEHSCVPITDDSLVGVVGLADEYQVDHVMTKCRKYVDEQLKDTPRLSTAQLVMYLWLCKRYRHGLCPRDCAGGTSTSAVQSKPLATGSASSGLGPMEQVKQSKLDSHGLALRAVFHRPLPDIQKCQFYSQLTQDERNNIILGRCLTLEKHVSQFTKRMELAFLGGTCYCSSNRRYEDPHRPLCSGCIYDVAKTLFCG